MLNWCVGNVVMIPTIAASIYIWCKAPAEHPNHRLTEKKKTINQYRARVLLMTIWIIQILLMLFNIERLITASSLVVCLVTVMMIIKNTKGE